MISLIWTYRVEDGEGSGGEASAGRLHLLGHPVQLLLVSDDLHALEVRLDPPHHLGLRKD